MRIISAVDLSFAVSNAEKLVPATKQSPLNRVESREGPARFSTAPEAGDREIFQSSIAEIEKKGMEVSFSVDPSSGQAQMVVVEAGTGREVLKVPSDSALYQALRKKTQDSF